ncbi:DUF4012 domain-containing protein [Candidatus Parcubacteria bacterium]|nr:DUF4012 domain-containing protein [Candidatus Parcubacteria bacterium]
MQKSRNNFIKVDDGLKSSRFLVDLNNLGAATEDKTSEKNKLFNRIMPAGFSLPAFLNTEKLKRLSFYPFFIFIFKALYLFVWIILFSFRLVSLAFKNFFTLFSWLPRIREKRIKKEQKKVELKSEESEEKVEEDWQDGPRESFEPVINISEPIVNRPPSIFRSLVAYATVLVMIALPLKLLTYQGVPSEMAGRVLGTTELALNDIISAGVASSEINFDEASAYFASAEQGFDVAREQVYLISKIAAFLSPIIPNEKLRQAEQADYIIQAGIIAAEMGQYFSQLADRLLDGGEIETGIFIMNLAEASYYLETKSLALEEIIEKIDPQVFPDEYVAIGEMMKQQGGRLSKSAKELRLISDLVLSASGFDMDSRLLFVFQNNTELRGSGGFVGSYALVDFHDGEIKNIETPGGGSYDTEAGLYTCVQSPEPLWLVNPRWYFWDANWWPDWPMSASKLMWFLEESNGPSVDGVISITPTVMERILKIIGPLDMTLEYGEIITHENFWPVIQSITETKPLVASSTASTTEEQVKPEPKKIIGDLLALFLSELPKRLDKENVIKLIGVFLDSFNEKQTLAFFNDKLNQQIIKDLNWDAGLNDTKGDYLMAVNTNIAGGKTDKVIRETIDLFTRVEENGAVINELKITREHTGEKQDEFTGVRNVNWLRVYVPEGARLISASGWRAPDQEFFDKPDKGWLLDKDIAANEAIAVTLDNGTKIYTEKNKTVFANWTMTDPGQTTVIKIKYELPVKLDYHAPPLPVNLWEEFISPPELALIPYSLMLQKQPGSLGSKFSQQFIKPLSLRLMSSYGDMETNQHGWTINTTLISDKFYAATFE